jgi:hypothetical protein
MYRKLMAAFVALAAVALALSVIATGLSQRTSPVALQSGPSAMLLGAPSPGASPSLLGSSAGSCGQNKIPLGAAGNFEVLAGTTVTNTGATIVHGNLGVSPGSAVVGFPPGKVTGTIDVANAAAARAQTALSVAYTNGMGRTNCPVSVAGNIGGRTLGPGLYHSSSSLAISSGDLTLTAHGHSGDVFIFQVTSKLTVTSGRQVILAGGAQARNIYWIVGSSATLGTTSVVYGNILAHKSISMATGAKLHGRALAHIGAVTMAGNTLRASIISGAAPSVPVQSIPTPLAAGTSMLAAVPMTTPAREVSG